jgi:hypothetical protein
VSDDSFFLGSVDYMVRDTPDGEAGYTVLETNRGSSRGLTLLSSLLLDVEPQRGKCAFPQVDKAFLGSLPQHLTAPTREINVAQLQAHDLRRPRPGIEEKQHQGSCTPLHHRLACSCYQRLDSFLLQCLRFQPGQPGCWYTASRVALDQRHVGRSEPGEQRGDCSVMAAHRERGKATLALMLQVSPDHVRADLL